MTDAPSSKATPSALILPATFREFLWIWNQDQGLETPLIHLQIASWLEDAWRSGEKALLLLAFRSSGKSTIVGIFCAWLLAECPDLRILVLAAELSLARRMVRMAQRVLERHPLLHPLKPARPHLWSSEAFTVKRDCELREPSMVARGITANITGSRADLIICDDVEVPNTADTAPKRSDLRTRLSEIEYVKVPGGTQLFVGTPHTYYSIYADTPRTEVGEIVPFLNGFHRLELPVLGADGESIWPERFTPQRLAAMKRRTGPSRFASQMLLQPTAITRARLDPDRLRLYDGDLVLEERNGESVLTINETRMLSASAFWDPAFAQKTGDGEQQVGDSAVVAVVFSDGEGRYWLHRVRYLTHDPNVSEEPARQLCSAAAAFAEEFYVPSLSVETNGLGRFLPSLLRQIIGEENGHCAVLEVHQSKPKTNRILEAFEAVLAAGALHAHRSVWDTPFIQEMREWRPAAANKGGRHHDDGLDAVAGCLLSEPVRLPRRISSSQSQKNSRWRSYRLVRANTTFSV